MYVYSSSNQLLDQQSHTETGAKWIRFPHENTVQENNF